jgi:deoxyribonuclease (pyrimidine dimer)
VYVLGTGHCRFFYSRLSYLSKRHGQLVAEMLSRGYKPTFEEPRVNARVLPLEWWNDWAPDDAAQAINRARIADRLAPK